MPGQPPALSCPRCAASWPTEPGELSQLEACPACRGRLRIEVFPAWRRESAPGTAAQPVVEAGESVCFHHPQKRAIVPCDQCGRFLCALCDVELDGRHYCPGCLDRTARTGGIAALERCRTRWDVVVWWLLVAPLILCGGLPMPLTAPTAFTLAMLKRRAPPSLVARSGLWLRVGCIVAVIEFGLGVALWIGMGSG